MIEGLTIGALVKNSRADWFYARVTHDGWRLIDALDQWSEDEIVMIVGIRSMPDTARCYAVGPGCVGFVFVWCDDEIVSGRCSDAEHDVEDVTFG